MNTCNPRLLSLVISPLFVLATHHAHAQWPDEQPIKIIVPQAAGGTNDTLARLVSAELAKSLGQVVIVENKPGASGAIGLQTASQAKPDGYTLALASDSAALLDVVRPNPNWSFISSLRGVGMIGEQPISVAVSAKSPYQSFQEVVAAGKAKPGSLAYGSSGTGSSQNIIGEWMAQLAGMQLVHIPYKGGGQASADLISGHTPLAVLGLAPMLKQHQAGTVRIVAITTPNRSAALPEVPTLTELGYPQIAVSQWAGLMAPANVPAPIISRLSEELTKILALDTVKEKMQAAGVNPSPMNHQQFDSFLKKNVDTWREVVPTLNIEVQ